MSMTYEEALKFLEGYTLGIELEIANCNSSVTLPEGNKWCTKEGSIINANRVGNDPDRVYNYRGGEIQVKPTGDFSPETELVDRVVQLLNITECEPIRDPNTFHVHIRVPNLLDDKNYQILKDIINYAQKYAPFIFKMVSDLPSMDLINNQQYHSPEQSAMFRRGYRDKYRSRHGILPEASIERINNPEVTTIDGIINSLPSARDKNGRPVWISYNRTGVNFKKLRSDDIGTIEFRCFSGSSDIEVIRNIAEFPVTFMVAALMNMDENNLRNIFINKKYPGYYGWTMETDKESKIWIATDRDKIDKPVVINNVKELLLDYSITLDSLGNPPYWKQTLGEEVYNNLLDYSSRTLIMSLSNIGTSLLSRASSSVRYYCNRDINQVTNGDKVYHKITEDELSSICFVILPLACSDLKSYEHILKGIRKDAFIFIIPGQGCAEYLKSLGFYKLVALSPAPFNCRNTVNEDGSINCDEKIEKAVTIYSDYKSKVEIELILKSIFPTLVTKKSYAPLQTIEYLPLNTVIHNGRLMEIIETGIHNNTYFYEDLSDKAIHYMGQIDTLLGQVYAKKFGEGYRNLHEYLVVDVYNQDMTLLTFFKTFKAYQGIKIPKQADGSFDSSSRLVHEDLSNLKKLLNEASQLGVSEDIISPVSHIYDVIKHYVNYQENKDDLY